MSKWVFAAFGSLLWLTLSAQHLQSDDFLVRLLNRDSLQLGYFLKHKDSLELQIIYTQINRDANNVPSFRSFYFNVDSRRYFYPASTVKLPVVLQSLEKLNKLHIQGLGRNTTMLTDSVYSGQVTVHDDSTADNCLPSIGHYARKILVASDNKAYNRLYEFLGQQAANEELRKKGYRIRLLHRLEQSATPDENRHTQAVRFVSGNSVIYSQPMLTGDSIRVGEVILKGIAHYRGNARIEEPFDFSYKNYFPLADQQRLLRALLFPSSVAPHERFAITDDDRRFVLQYMSQLPIETGYPAYYLDTLYKASMAKLLMFAHRTDTIPRSIRIFNKYGDAYGYLIDNAYIVDFEHNVEFMLSAVIHANLDGVYNNGDYEYMTVGYPFMRRLGQLLYRYELHRPRLRSPDLSEFRLHYDLDPRGK